eukprot:CAMPEP_0179247840 /NCGR_PEP_ID=MMETSP0797-20121207/19819_1 /TAXON_ID=47934 /ORGANISM="Dinophysis acuminata, Strain DAEP01" /LENGTH=129 /DNA_ID=CAMNT_0020955477 /DNA_START=162 /DNA_END=548 /DNA_ORIENTATION=+
MKLIQTVKRRMGTEDKKSQSNPPVKGKAAASGTKQQNAKSASEPNTFASLPKLREAPPSERHELFRKKMEVCAVVFDFHNESTQREKEAKRQTLLEIVEYVNNTRNCFNEALMHDVVHMVGVNIFRALQ